MGLNDLSDKELDELIAKKSTPQKSLDQMSDEELNAQILASAPKEDKPWYSVSPGGLMEGAIESLPAAGAAVGGLLGAGAGGIGAIPGAAAGGAVGAGARGLIKSLLYDKAPLRPPTMAGIYQAAKEQAGGAVEGATQEVGGQLLAKGVGLLGAAKRGVGKEVGRFTAPAAKPEAEAITKATQELGAEPTAGMLTKEPVVQKMESSIAQSPFSSGDVIRNKIQKVQDALVGGVKQVEEKAAKNSAVEIGDKIKEDLISSVGKKYGPVQAMYQDLEKELPNIALDPKRVAAVNNNILGHEDAILGNRKIAQQIATELEGIKTVDQLSRVRSALNSQATQAYRSGDAFQGNFLRDIVTKIDRLQKGSITRAAYESLPATKAGAAEAESAAEELFSSMKGARKGYREVMTYIEDLGGFTKMKGRLTPSQFVDKLESIPSEQLAQKMIQKNDHRTMQAMKDVLPETFESIKQLEIANLIGKSNAKGEVSIQRLLNNYDKYTPEMKKLLFDDEGMKLIENMRTVKGALPEKVGPSGTPEGMSYKEYAQVLSPKFWIDALGTKLKAGALEGAEATLRGAKPTAIGKWAAKAGAEPSQLPQRLVGPQMGGLLYKSINKKEY